jgi:DNA methylase
MHETSGSRPRTGLSEAHWRRAVERRRVEREELREGDHRRRPRRYDEGKGAARYGTAPNDQRYLLTRTVGWRPGCACPPHAPVPCTVLDPCAGAGTTGLVADRLGRDAVLVELHPGYAELARRRVVGDAPLFAQVEAAGRP